jgi:DNA-binding Lrp family transcriptional regulator
MAFTYILINCQSGFENSIIEKLIKIPEVKEVQGIFGIYDIFVKMESDSQDVLEDVFFTQIRKIPNITSTNSLSPIPSQGGK